MNCWQKGAGCCRTVCTCVHDFRLVTRSSRRRASTTHHPNITHQAIESQLLPGRLAYSFRKMPCSGNYRIFLLHTVAFCSLCCFWVGNLGRLQGLGVHLWRDHGWLIQAPLRTARAPRAGTQRATPRAHRSSVGEDPVGVDEKAVCLPRDVYLKA